MSIAAQCLWNRDLSFDQVLDDFCVNGSGTTSDVVHKYMTAFINAWERTDIDTAMRNGPVELLAVSLYKPA